MNANVGQIFCANLTLLKRKGDRPFSQGWLGATRQANPLRTVAITLTDPLGGLWRRFEGNRRLKVRSFIQLGDTISVAPRSRSNRMQKATGPVARARCRYPIDALDQRALFAQSSRRGVKLSFALARALDAPVRLMW